MRLLIRCAMLLAVTSQSLSAQIQPPTVITYTLPNGFTVILNPDPNTSMVYGAVAVKTGSRNDPADATGLAHYLEHLLFKGTSEMGTIDFEKEKPHLDSITLYYQQLSQTTDEADRKRIQLLINEQSVKAAAYGLPTEFNTLLKSIGATGINAFTTTDMTVYHNAFPAASMEKWIDIYAHRFQNPVFRGFQSELEVVYEEKNRASDNFQFQLFEALQKQLFKGHPYGDRTTIGTTEHLKNPRLDRMYEYFETYYVARNMALVLSGNFDPVVARPWIDEKFGALRSGEFPVQEALPAHRFKGREVFEQKLTPIKMSLLCFKSVTDADPDKPALDVVNALLFNESGTGRLNKLATDHKLLAAVVFPLHYNEDGAEVVLVVPKIVGQSLDAAEALVLGELTGLKTGSFSDADLEAVKTELYRRHALELEDNRNRALLLVQAFSQGVPWEQKMAYPQQVRNVTRDEVLRVARKYYGDDYLAFRSKMGKAKKDKLAKPGFKPVAVDESQLSAYANSFNDIPESAAKPRFLDFNSDANTLALNGSGKLYAVNNPYNDIASLTLRYHVGTAAIPNLDYAASLLNESGTSGMSADAVKQTMSRWGISYSFTADDDYFDLDLTGIETQFDSALWLMNAVLEKPVAKPEAIAAIKDGIKAERKLERDSPQQMGNILKDYALYGKKSNHLKRLSSKDAKSIKAEDLLPLVQQAIQYDASVHYVGNSNATSLKQLITTHYKLPNSDKSTPLHYEQPALPNENTVYVIDDPKARQAQVYFLVPGAAYNASDNAVISVFNQYIGGDFSGLILQEVREYRSLAYSAGGGYSKPVYEQKPGHFMAYVGCQADKTNEAVELMHGLITNMPRKENRFAPLSAQVQKRLAADFPSFRERSHTIESLRRRGFNEDPKRLEYTMSTGLLFDDVFTFYNAAIQSKPVITCVYGNTKQMDMAALSRYGKVVKLKVTDVMTP